MPVRFPILGAPIRALCPRLRAKNRQGGGCKGGKCGGGGGGGEGG